MKSRIGFGLLTAALLTTPILTAAQQQAKVARLGFLSNASPAAISARTEAFRQRLRELGYVDGKNIVIEYRYAEGSSERLAAFAAELARLNVEVIVTTGATVAPPRKQLL